MFGNKDIYNREFSKARKREEARLARLKEKRIVSQARHDARIVAQSGRLGLLTHKVRSDLETGKKAYHGFEKKFEPPKGKKKKRSSNPFDVEGKSVWGDL